MDSIIFDIDGTIWNSTDVVAMAWNKAFCRFYVMIGKVTVAFELLVSFILQ